MKKLAIGFAVVLAVFLGANTFTLPLAYAAQNDDCHKSAGFLGLPTWYEYLEIGQKDGDPCAIIGPTENGGKEFSFQKALPRIILAITDILLRVAGMVAVAYVIFGGFKYMTSQGEPDGLKSAQGTIINALIGLAIAILSVTIVSFVGSKLWG